TALRRTNAIRSPIGDRPSVAQRLRSLRCRECAIQSFEAATRYSRRRRLLPTHPPPGSRLPSKISDHAPASSAGLGSERDRRLRDADSLRSGTRTAFIASRTEGSTSLLLPIMRATANATNPQSLAISSELASLSGRRASA